MNSNPPLASLRPESLALHIGRTGTAQDLLCASTIEALSVTLGRDDPLPQTGDIVPLMAHWLCFAPKALTRDIGEDGHPCRGGFLPPIELPRRMWAGGRLQFGQPLHVGEEVRRTSTIADIRERNGRSGRLIFVTVHHEVHATGGLAVREEQTIVYRELASPDASTPTSIVSAPADEIFSREITPDPVLLFRYSALTFNGHRIHYDRPYATNVEGYPGLVVHGPLIATLLMDLALRQYPRLTVSHFDFKAVFPLFDTHPFTVCGRPDGAGRIALWARDHQGRLAMQAHLHH